MKVAKHPSGNDLRETLPARQSKDGHWWMSHREWERERERERERVSDANGTQSKASESKATRQRIIHRQLTVFPRSLWINVLIRANEWSMKHSRWRLRGERGFNCHRGLDSSPNTRERETSMKRKVACEREKLFGPRPLLDERRKEAGVTDLENLDRSDKVKGH